MRTGREAVTFCKDLLFPYEYEIYPEDGRRFLKTLVLCSRTFMRGYNNNNNNNNNNDNNKDTDLYTLIIKSLESILNI
jgi:hypothetical protein